MGLTDQTLEKIRSDKELRPLFFDFVCRGFALGLTDSFEVTDNERVRFQRNYYDSLLDLSSQIEKKVRPDEVLNVIEEVSKFYLSNIGRIGFENYEPSRK